MSTDIRAIGLIKKLISHFDVDLDGMTIYTEIATGPYLYPAFIASLANASKIYAIAKNSRYGPAKEIIKTGKRLAIKLGISSKLQFVQKKYRKHLSQCDIITNTGFVRPINLNNIRSMKKTAVIPLMWETWEFRKEDLNLDECKKNEILVLGTNEHEDPCNMAPYSGILAIKLLFDLKLEIYRNNILLLGGQPTLGGAIYKTLVSLGAQVKWFSSSQSHSESYEGLSKYFSKYGNAIDAIIVAEHSDKRLLIGEGGLLNLNDIKRINPAVRLGIITGGVDTTQLSNSGLIYEPRAIRQIGYMSYQPDLLGPQPVIELLTAGLKVGQAMANARLSGLDIPDSVKYALNNSPAMDFQGDNSWLQNQI